MNCVIYLRVSTEKQETDRQRSELIEYAKLLNYNILEILEEKDTGFSDERTEFLRLLTYTKSEIDAVIVWEISRLARKTSTIIKTIEDWASQGICLISKKENLCSLADGKLNSNTKLYLSVMATIAENEADTIKSRMRSGKIQKLRSGLSHCDKVPYGYRKVDGMLVINPEEAEKVRLAYRMKSEGYSIKVIASAIGRKAGATMHMLHSEIYRGTGRNKMVPEQVFIIPRVVSDELWNKCQIRTPAVRKTGEFVPLRCKIICPVCGRHMSHQTASSKKVDGKLRYKKPAAYKCSNGASAADGVPHPKYSSTINYEDTNNAVRQVVEEWSREKRKTEFKYDNPENLKCYVDVLKKDLESEERNLVIATKKLEAVFCYLTPAEKRHEQNAIAKIGDKIENIKIELASSQVRLDNAVALRSAAFLPTGEEPWHELVAQVKITSYSATGRQLEIETVSGEKLYTFVKTRRGCIKQPYGLHIWLLSHFCISAG